MEYFLAYDNDRQMFVVKCEAEDGSVTEHSAYHKRSIVQNTVLQLNARLEQEEYAPVQLQRVYRELNQNWLSMFAQFK
jgi:hypothetical protein